MTLLEHIKVIHLSISYAEVIIYLAFVTVVAFSYDDKLVVSASQDKCIRVFDFEQKQLLYTLEDAHKGILTPNPIIDILDWINSIALSRNTAFMVSASKDKSMKIYDINARQQLHHFENAHQGNVTLALFSELTFFFLRLDCICCHYK